ncbi:hypothetical protein AGLY_006154 [Aphis glycines]|uniref:Uncharacterized protein n=1 Tax=Aphis glycines TaxID=307491 RepID=A0A6G0TV95_APHGL|nr:hypothetical protein AGLY_006154 [Aphis glycines]
MEDSLELSESKKKILIGINTNHLISTSRLLSKSLPDPSHTPAFTVNSFSLREALEQCLNEEPNSTSNLLVLSVKINKIYIYTMNKRLNVSNKCYQQKICQLKKAYAIRMHLNVGLRYIEIRLIRTNQLAPMITFFSEVDIFLQLMRHNRFANCLENPKLMQIAQFNAKHDYNNKSL